MPLFVISCNGTNHVRKVNGLWAMSQHRTGAWSRVEKVDGSDALHWTCGLCGDRSSAVPHERVRRFVYFESTKEFPLDHSYVGANPACERCGASETQRHHYAPIEAFGWDDAETFSTGYLCPDCHSHYHRVLLRWAREVQRAA